MKKTNIIIDVCIGTYKRPELLSALLHSVQQIDTTNAFCIKIIVIDNDSKQSAKTIVDKSRNASPIEIVYDIEPVRGISYVRNRALTHVRSDYFAFLDDDEIVAKDWLRTMYATLKKYHADAVFGPVLSILPEDAPSWAKSHPSFMQFKRTTGQKLLSGGTGNVLVHTKALGKPMQTFAPDFALTGGGDTDFFYRLYLAGKKLIWCNEAIVWEHIPAHRLTTKWVYRRALRGGQVFSRVYVIRYPFHKKISWLILKVLQLIIGFAGLPVVRIYSYSHYVQLHCKVYKTVGQLTGLTGSLLQYKEYDKINYQ